MVIVKHTSSLNYKVSNLQGKVEKLESLQR